MTIDTLDLDCHLLDINLNLVNPADLPFGGLANGINLDLNCLPDRAVVAELRIVGENLLMKLLEAAFGLMIDDLDAVIGLVLFTLGTFDLTTQRLDLIAKGLKVYDMTLVVCRKMLGLRSQLLDPLFDVGVFIAESPHGFDQLTYVSLQRANRPSGIINPCRQFTKLLTNARLFELSGLRRLRHLVLMLLKSKPILRRGALARLELIFQPGAPGTELSNYLAELIYLLLQPELL
ncbi:MAG: hypothetical protein WD401_03665 [Thermomicrobiaceae bacterium]